jgi:5-methylcytosine-specific restriction enzyme A
MRGVTTTATTVDHKVRVSTGGDPFPPLSGLMSMCASCHNSKTMTGDVHGGVALKGAGVDGLPIDPAHPFTSGGYVSPRPQAPRGHTPPKDGQPRARDRLGSRVSTKFRGL